MHVLGWRGSILARVLLSQLTLRIPTLEDNHTRPLLAAVPKVEQVRPHALVFGCVVSGHIAAEVVRHDGVGLRSAQGWRVRAGIGGRRVEVDLRRGERGGKEEEACPHSRGELEMDGGEGSVARRWVGWGGDCRRHAGFDSVLVHCSGEQNSRLKEDSNSRQGGGHKHRKQTVCFRSSPRLHLHHEITVQAARAAFLPPISPSCLTFSLLSLRLAATLPTLSTLFATGNIAMPKPVQLGTVRLLSLGSAGSPSKPPQWVPTDSAFLERTSWHTDSEAVADLLAQCLRDSCLGASLSRRQDGRVVRVRVSVTPNDDRSWNSSSHRVKRLKRLFPLLEKGWDGKADGEILLQVPVSTGSSADRWRMRRRETKTGVSEHSS